MFYSEQKIDTRLWLFNPIKLFMAHQPECQQVDLLQLNLSCVINDVIFIRVTNKSFSDGKHAESTNNTP